MTRTLTVTLKDGTKETVELFCKFCHKIDGQLFEFAVTKEVNGLHKVVTHVASGLKVCALSVGAAYLPAYRHLGTDVARAQVSLQQLIDRVGEARVRSVISAAEPQVA